MEFRGFYRNLTHTDDKPADEDAIVISDEGENEQV